MNDAGNVVETEQLTKLFDGKTVVDHVDLHVPRGTAFGYLGPNGAGKTTLIRMLLGLTRPSAGTMKLRGLSVPNQRRQALARVGAIVDEPRFHSHMTGRQNLWTLAAAREPEAHTRIEAALDRVGLRKRADDRVAKYSMGMRQRLGIAACLIAEPELLILDEPMNGLDPAGMLELRGLIRSLVAEGRTVVLSSHLLDEVEKTCDAVAIVDRGKSRPPGTDRRAARGRRRDAADRVQRPGARHDAVAAPHRRRKRAHGGQHARPAARGRQPAHRDRARRARPARRRLRPVPARARPRLARGAVPRAHLTARRRSMTSLTLTSRPPLGPRLIRAEILKLTTRRGPMIAAALLTVGATIATFAILAGLHATDPTHHKLIGGLSHFDDGMYSLTQLATVAAILIGATAGAGDLASGFFRNLVVTGCPRSLLYLARIPGGLAVLLPVTATAYAFLAALSQLVPGSAGTSSTTLMVEGGLWFELYVAVMFLLALGLASLLGSRATSLGVLAGLQLLITPVVQGLHNPGVGADAVLGIALWRLAPKELLNGAPAEHIQMSLAAAVAVVVVWMLLALGLGVWRTITRDA